LFLFLTKENLRAKRTTAAFCFGQLHQHHLQNRFPVGASRLKIVGQGFKAQSV
jgi:hypothetical protein